MTDVSAASPHNTLKTVVAMSLSVMFHVETSVFYTIRGSKSWCFYFMTSDNSEAESHLCCSDLFCVVLKRPQFQP